MNYLFNQMSIWTYSIIIIIFGAILIYGIIDMKNKKPGHPFVNALYGLLIVGLYTVPYRFIKEYSSNSALIDISQYLMWIIMAIFIITFIYYAYLAYKKGFLDEKGRRLLHDVIIPCIIFIVIGVVIIVTYILAKKV